MLGFTSFLPNCLTILFFTNSLLNSFHMTIKINKNTTAAIFQMAFNAEFPNLKIAFFRQNAGNDIWSSQMILNNQILLGEISDVLMPQITTEDLTVSPNVTVAEFETMLQNRYGLTARIFRQHNGDWIETTDSRHLDLEGQNERSAVKTLVLETSDY
jgi:hypothetical protein